MPACRCLVRMIRRSSLIPDTTANNKVAAERISVADA
jgi:hypothetical protein